MKNGLCSIVAAIGLFSFAQAAHAATIFFLFEGNNASGDIDGNAFANASWRLEYGVDDTVADSDGLPQYGVFLNSITEGHIEINGTVYELTGTSAAGNIRLEDISEFGIPGADGDRASVHPSSGGFMILLTADNQIYPPLFTNNNSLATAVLGQSVTDSTTDSFNNSSEISLKSWMGTA